jgi:hypothetical protein
MKATKFSESIEINGGPALVFDYTQDYGNRLKWDTFLIEAYLLHDAIEADKGVKAWCVAKNGIGMETEYVSFNRPKVAAIKMTKGPYMFSDFAASWTFVDTGSGMTKVTFLYSYRLRFPYNVTGVWIKFILRRNVRQRLKDLKSRFSQCN